MSSFIRHRGTVIGFSSKPGNIQVEICNESACAGCHAASACGFGKPKRKKIQAVLPEGCKASVGDNVTLQLPVSSGFFAVFVVYVIPLLLLLTTLLLFSSLLPEWAAGLICLCVLPLWYGVVYGFRKFFEQHSVITVEKISG